MKQLKLRTPVGVVYLLASEKGLRGLNWAPELIQPGAQKAGLGAKRSQRISRILKQAAREVTEYFEGKRRRFQIPLDLEGTPFQRRVWEELMRIPYGETCSYAELALRIQKPRAFRAVGNANGKNPVAIIVPCHRVVAADGSMGGYSSGIPIKARLLKLEGSPGIHGPKVSKN